MLESVKHAASVFVTLTYASESLPMMACLQGKGDALPTLYPRDVQLWLKRYRKANGKFRYFLVGEYGSETWRPHYHAALFGVEHMLCGVCRHQYRREHCDCSIFKAWGKGNVFVGQITDKSSSYIAGYVTKKLTKKEDPQLDGRYPEFARMSLRPGIGADAMKDVARSLNSDFGMQAIIDHGDVPGTIRMIGKVMPFGRYLKRKLREELGLDEELLKKDRMEKFRSEIESQLEGKAYFFDETIKDILVDADAQKAVKQEKRSKIFAQRRTL